MYLCTTTDNLCTNFSTFCSLINTTVFQQIHFGWRIIQELVIVKDSGMLFSPLIWGFVHRQFQQYLAFYCPFAHSIWQIERDETVSALGGVNCKNLSKRTLIFNLSRWKSGSPDSICTIYSSFTYEKFKWTLIFSQIFNLSIWTNQLAWRCS